MSDDYFNSRFTEEEKNTEDESFRSDEIYTYYGSRRGASHRHHSRRKRKRRIIIAAVLLSIPLVLIASGIIMFFHYYNLMDIRSVADISVSYSNIEVTFTDAEIAEVPEGEVVLPEGEAYSEKDITNILLIGTDERTSYFNYKSRADSMMILSLNKSTNEVKLISLERGMLVQIPGRKPDILTHTFRYGGADLLIQTVESHFKIKIDNYVRINFYMFEQLIDEIGGVDVSISRKEADAINARNKNLSVSEGMNHMDGKTALAFSRLRRIDSDWQRIKRQRKVIVAIKAKMKDQSVFEMRKIAESCLPYVQTDLSSLEFASLLMNLPNLVNGEFEDMTIPQTGTYQGLGNVNFSENSRILKEFIYRK